MVFASFVCLLTGLWIGARIVWALNRYAYRPISVHDSPLPSVSVCIAARNEVHALAQCLDYVLTSGYEKLEILVLDDSSNDETSRIIQSYAHAGVRFIPGKDLPSGWLGKNHAYQTLAEEASGDYILYLDVDTLLAQSAIQQLVQQIVANDKDMLSVLPRREDALRASAIFSTLRYVWELVLATRSNPPSASALWLIRRDTLLQMERGLSDYGMSVRPERHLAKQLQYNKKYYHIVGTKKLGVRYEKHWHSHLATAERLYYPMFGHRYVSIVLGLITMFSVAAPPIIFIVSLLNHKPVAATVALSALVVDYVWFGIFTGRTMASRGWIARMIVWPYIALQELALYLDSCTRYATGTVRWKGRAIHAQPLQRDHYVINE